MIAHPDEYICLKNLDLYNSPGCTELATQARQGRHLVIIPSESQEGALRVQLCEDCYYAWLSTDNLDDIQPVETPYEALYLSLEEIQSRLPGVIAFTKAAMDISNYYLWGGTVSPHYDCSGLMQASFSSEGIWIPRDSYQQEAFCEPIHEKDLQPGDLIFFGEERVNHVGLYLGEGYYIHSSGKEKGRDGIAIDILSDTGDEISQHYFHKFWGFRRVTRNYCG
ncbi:MAG: hypothetical protein N5P05_003310 [Chroococcopsis gigantea SAG 12.99]|jgi:hypothetical protein|nr:C40 family peptidase [Chlorogloea purpurea SAG 13.99]MDV3001704.1 hypothetical protein [Chroococcopsis gigantea SAG 12.99]